MASLRTAAEIQAEYEAARTAYLAAVGQSAVSVSTGSGGFSKSNQDAESLLSQMRSLEREYRAVTRGGLRVRGARPIDG